MFGWCMWQFMHWAVGIARVKAWRSGWPRSFSPSGPRRSLIVGSDGHGLAPVAVLRVAARGEPVAVVGVDDVAAGAARRAEVARVVVGAEEPEERIVEARLVTFSTGTEMRAPVPGPRFEARMSGLPGSSSRFGQADLGELRDVAQPAALEDAEDVRRRDGLPRGQRQELLQHAALLLVLGRRPGRDDLAGQRDALAFLVALLGALVSRRRVIGLAEDVALEGKDPVVVGGAAPEHGPAGHEAALDGRHLLAVAGAAGGPRHPQVARIDEADELRRFLVEEGVGALRVSRRALRPGLRVAGLDVRLLLRRVVLRRVHVRRLRLRHAGVAAVAVGAAQHHGRVAVHRGLVGGMVAGHAAGALGVRLRRGLLGRRRRMLDVEDVAGFLALRSRGPHLAATASNSARMTPPARIQYVSTRLASAE